MINAFVGKPGTGKTYSMVRLAVNAIAHGRDVYSNFFIDELKVRKLLEKEKNKEFGTIYFWKTIQDLVKIREGEILMDEAQIYINSREFRTLPPAFQYKAQQHRKHGVNFWLGVQNIKRVDTVARELINSIYELKRIKKLFVCREYDVEEIDKVKRQCYSLKIYMLNKKIASCYDTMQEIKSENFISIGEI